MTDLIIEKLCKRYGKVSVLQDIDLRVEHGEFVVFVGPSGCGKSTLLRLICGLDELTSGQIIIDDELMNDVPSSRRGIAMVFQSYALYPHMSVEQNMGYALKLAKVPADQIAQRVATAADILKIGDYLNRKPRQLSGGQRQRVAIGRAIVREPRIFLFDEPLSNLDASLRVDMRMEFARLKQRLGTTMIYVTHDQVEAMTLADKIVVMNDGRIEQVGSPIELYERPANKFVAGFIGSPKMNFLPADVKADRLVLSGGQMHIANVHADVKELGVRPEHLRPGNDGIGVIEGKLLATEHLGSDTYAHVDLADTERPVMVRLPGEQRFTQGESFSLTFDPEHTYLFDAQGHCVERSMAQGNIA